MRRRPRLFQDLFLQLQLRDLPPQPHQLRPLVHGQVTGPAAVAFLPHPVDPVAQRLVVDAQLPAHVPDRPTGVEHQRRSLAPELLGVLALSSHSDFLLLGRMPSQEVSGLRGSLQAPYLVNRQFTADGPNRLWVADATRIPCGEGVFWLAAVRDVFSRRIVGWKTSDRCDTDLILAALEYGIWSRDVRDGQLIHHSDRGSNCTSFRFAERLQDNGILPSMGSVGDSFDNALLENFWSTLKIELVYRTSWRTRDEAENAIFAYIDGWCNTRRIQRELGYLSPNEYETAWHSRHTEPAEPTIAAPAPAGSR